jgi:hypothetical protein
MMAQVDPILQRVEPHMACAVYQSMLGYIIDSEPQVGLHQKVSFSRQIT